jgi:hypothetical protein
MARGWRSKSPRPKDQGLCGTRLCRLLIGGISSQGAHRERGKPIAVVCHLTLDFCYGNRNVLAGTFGENQ